LRCTFIGLDRGAVIAGLHVQIAQLHPQVALDRILAGSQKGFEVRSRLNRVAFFQGSLGQEVEGFIRSVGTVESGTHLFELGNRQVGVAALQLHASRAQLRGGLNLRVVALIVGRLVFALGQVALPQEQGLVGLVDAHGRLRRGGGRRGGWRRRLGWQQRFQHRNIRGGGRRRLLHLRQAG
jgi:hypothetical protein